MTKEQQFITEVQTALTIYYLKKEGTLGNAVWCSLISMDKAFQLSQKIPENLSAHKAACDFITHMLDTDEGTKHDIPAWLGE